MDLWEIYKASKGVPHSGDLYDALMGKALGGAGSVWETETAPYFFRQSGGLLNSRLLGKEKDTIVGASVGWNSLISPTDFIPTQTKNSVVYTPNNDGTFTLNGTSDSADYWSCTPRSNNNTVFNHIYFLREANHKGSANTFGLGFRTSGIIAYGNTDAIVKCQLDGSRVTYQYAANVTMDNVTLKPMLIDLTLLLGSTIADYAYTLETQQAGKGVKWLKDYGFFSEPYYAYDGGSIKSVSGLSAHKCVGFNLLEDDVISGEYSTYVNSMSASNVASFVASLEKMQSLGKTLYYKVTISDSTTTGVAVGQIRLLDANASVVKIISPNSTFDLSGIDLSLASSVVLYGRNSGSTTLSDVCFNISNADLNGTYKAYEEHEYALDSTVELRGLFKMDADHNIYADGDTYESSGKVARYWGERAYEEGDVSDYLTMITDGTTTIYKLAEPIIETATPFTNPQTVSKDGTEEYVTTQKFVPIGHETEYKCTPTP